MLVRIPDPIKRVWQDFYLLYINITNAFYNFYLFIIEVFKFYPNPLLRKVDLELLKVYAFKDQFTISNEYRSKLEDSDTEDFTYGEAVWSSIAKAMECVDLPPGSIFFDLGCGNGRICFFMNIYYSFEVQGVDLIPEFIIKAQKISQKYNLEKIAFYNKSWLDLDIEISDLIFIAGTCLDDKSIEELSVLFKKLKVGAYILSVSVSFASEQIKLVKKINLPFSWGKADLFILKKIRT